MSSRVQRIDGVFGQPGHFQKGIDRRQKADGCVHSVLAAKVFAAGAANHPIVAALPGVVAKRDVFLKWASVQVGEKSCL